MKRAMCVGVLAAVVSLSAPGQALAVLCTSYGDTTHDVWEFRWTDHSYTDRSEWHVANPGYPFDGIRALGATTTWGAHSNGGSLYFDNGTFSPWRRTGLYNNATVQYTWAYQYNDNTTCT